MHIQNEIIGRTTIPCNIIWRFQSIKSEQEPVQLLREGGENKS